jgi:hypothetical protein
MAARSIGVCIKKGIHHAKPQIAQKTEWAWVNSRKFSASWRLCVSHYLCKVQ